MPEKATKIIIVIAGGLFAVGGAIFEMNMYVSIPLWCVAVVLLVLTLTDRWPERITRAINKSKYCNATNQ